jgi:S-adenosylmethionine uptake transporter
MLGIGLMAMGVLCYALSDASAKLLTQHLPPFQVVWFRQLGLLTVALWFLARRGPAILRTRRPALQLSRGLVAALSSSAFIFAVGYVPLADAVAVSFVAPFIVTVLGALLLHETVGLRRWSAISVGFLGMLIVVRPGFGVFHPAMLLVVAAAGLFSVRQILSRLLGPVDQIVTTIAYTALASTALLTIPMLLVWQNPETPRQMLLLALLAASAGAGEVFVVRALDLAEAAALAPIQYTMILWSTGLGWLLFAQLPDFWTLIGAAIIMASGIYTVHRERLAAQRAAAGPG